MSFIGGTYKTSCFEKLENAVKAAVDYLGKCGVEVAEVKGLLVDHLRCNANVTARVVR